MSEALAELLEKSPNCRVTIKTPGLTIRYNPRATKPRRQPREGDVKIVRGKRFVRRQQYSEFYRAYLVNRRGQPRWEWVQEDEPEKKS